MSTLQILYRGPLESCNYGCNYCPFAKHRDTANNLRADRTALNRFVSWAEHASIIGSRVTRLEILFTPWGEAMHRARYARAMASLASMSHVDFVGIQTNLSVVPRWADKLSMGDRSKLNLWATWHPSETKMRSFVDRVAQTRSLGVGLSVGFVATKEHLPLVQSFADALHQAGSHLQWINAYKRGYRTPANYYSPDDLVQLQQLDPWFLFDLEGQRSGGRLCSTGSSAISVDGDGTVTRCHFTTKVLGNLYHDPIDRILAPINEAAPCPRAMCTCFQGYVHIPNTVLSDSFLGASRLARRELTPST